MSITSTNASNEIHLPFVRVQVAAQKSDSEKWLRTLTAKLLPKHRLIETEIGRTRQEIRIGLNAANDLVEKRI